MAMKQVVLRYSPWYASNGCDCCDSTEMPAYEMYLDGVSVESAEDFPVLYSSEAEALITLLEKLGYEVDIEY